MFNLLMDAELEYVRCFSKELKTRKFSRFWDDDLDDMYAYNLTIVHDNVFIEDINNIIDKEIKQSRSLGKEFLVVEINGEASEEFLRNLKLKPSSVDRLYYMSIPTKEYRNMKFNMDCKVAEVKTKDEFQKLIKLSILDNSSNWGKEFSEERIRRKVKSYKENNSLKVFLSYKDAKPMGSCELLIHNKVAKIEDFGVSEEFQRKGFGTTILRNMVKRSNEAKVEFAYVITDSKDTVNDMYRKCGFKKVGEKTQLIFSFM
jgi:spore maturation protein CgeE